MLRGVFAINRNVLFLAIVPIICCLFTIGYINATLSKSSKELQVSQLERVSMKVEDNRTLTAANAAKIDELHRQIVRDTIYRFKSKDMQVWIRAFKLENPDLQIPDLIMLEEQQPVREGL